MDLPAKPFQHTNILANIDYYRMQIEFTRHSPFLENTQRNFSHDAYPPFFSYQLAYGVNLTIGLAQFNQDSPKKDF